MRGQHPEPILLLGWSLESSALLGPSQMPVAAAGGGHTSQDGLGAFSAWLARSWDRLLGIAPAWRFAILGVGTRREKGTLLVTEASLAALNANAAWWQGVFSFPISRGHLLANQAVGRALGGLGRAGSREQWGALSSAGWGQSSLSV